MNTKIFKIEDPVRDAKAIAEAASILREGGVVAFPTETVYGLGGNALDAYASGKIFRAKGRPQDNPLIVHIASLSALETLCHDVPDEAYALASAYWPGPLTMILPKNECIPDATTAGLDTAGIRMPSHPVARRRAHRDTLAGRGREVSDIKNGRGIDIANQISYHICVGYQWN